MPHTVRAAHYLQTFLFLTQPPPTQEWSVKWLINPHFEKPHGQRKVTCGYKRKIRGLKTAQLLDPCEVAEQMSEGAVRRLQFKGNQSCM